jgi:hypothetical protein
MKSPIEMGKKIFKLIEKNKLLLLQDKIFPNIVSEVIGKEIAGSWWGHQLANPIYNGLQWLEHNRNVLTLKLVDGKVTYLHESLFADIFSIVCEPRDWQLKRLSDSDHDLLKYIFKKTKVTSDDLYVNKLTKDTKKSFVTLERKLLVYSIEEHTESGKHVKQYMNWKKSKIAVSNPKDYLQSIENIERIVGLLNIKSGAKAKLPW